MPPLIDTHVATIMVNALSTLWLVRRLSVVGENVVVRIV